MATATLNWVPGGGGGQQVVQYKLSTSAVWNTYSTISSASTTETIPGLADNILYNFRVYNNCLGGTSNFIERSMVKITCPSVSAVSTDTTAQISFNHLGGNVDKYVVTVSNSGNAVVDTYTTTAPFDGTITHLFTGLDPSSNYTVKITPFVGSLSKTNCESTSFGTQDSPTCGIITGVSSTMS